MSNVTRSKVVLEALLDKTFTDEAHIALVDNITSYQQAQNFTDEQKCERFLTLWSRQLLNVVQGNAESQVRRDAELAAIEAGNTAIANL